MPRSPTGCLRSAQTGPLGLTGYTALVDDQQSGILEAFTEIRLAGGIETGELGDILKEVPEVREFFTIAGDPDALVRIVVDDVDHLQRVVNALRRTGKLTGTKTLIVMQAWSRYHEPIDANAATRLGETWKTADTVDPAHAEHRVMVSSTVPHHRRRTDPRIRGMNSTTPKATERDETSQAE